MRNNLVSSARSKAKKVHKDVAVAEAKLHESNAILANSAIGQAVTRQSVDTAVKQNVDVEEKLHAAVEELEVVSELLNVAVAKNAEHDDQAVAGRRSGEGLASVMDQMSASALEKARRELDIEDSLRPAPAGNRGLPPTSR